MCEFSKIGKKLWIFDSIFQKHKNTKRFGQQLKNKHLKNDKSTKSTPTTPTAR